tara:strand:- start:1027 stop:3618 length:2592 start_codon:yes stop_codon:yes gene_type:complete
MAGIFAPKLQSEVAYERPVEQPSMLGALAGLGGDFLQSYSASQRSGGASGSTKVDPQLGTFAKGLERVEAIRNEKGEQAALIAERQLATNFAMQGVEFDTDYQNVYTKTTGRVWAGYGRDNEDFMREQSLQDPQVQASYVASYALLPQDATDEQRIEYAIGQRATIQASSDVIARSKAEQGYQWSVQTEAAYNNAIDTFLNTNLGALVATQQQGGTVGPQSLANLSASWSQLKVGVSRPSGVLDDQWKSTQAKITSIDNLLTTLTKASSSDVLFEEITTALVRTLIAEGDGSPESILAAATAIKDPTSFRDLSGLGGRIDDFIMTVGKSINLDISQPQLFGHIAEQTGLGETVGGNITIDTLPASVASKVEGLSPQQWLDGLKASGQFTALTDANTLQRPEGRQQFVENSAGIGAVLMGMGNDDFLSASFLTELVGNRQFIQNVKTLDSVDPEGATVARTYVRSGLNTELVRQQRNLAAVEATSTATWNGSNYVIDQEQLRTKVPTSRIEDFNRSLQKNYGGDILSGVRDGFRRMNDVTDVVQLAGLYNLEGAVDRRDAIGVINETLKGLAVEEPAGAITFDVGQLSGQTSTDLITTAESVLGLNEDKQKDVLSSFLSAGGVEIDPSQTAWCAAFVNATLTKTGLDGTGALNARSFLDWGTEITSPQLGDVVVLSRGDNPAQGHVGFFKGFDADGNILILGGNQGDSVNVQSFNKDRLLGYRRPEGATGIGTEAGLSQSVYRAAVDPNFLPDPSTSVEPMVTAPTTSLRPQARPEVAPEAVEVDQTTTEGGSFGGQGLVRVIDSPGYSRELQRLLQALQVNPDQTFIVADLDEFDAAVADGRLKKGEEVVVGSGDTAFVKKVE